MYGPGIIYLHVSPNFLVNVGINVPYMDPMGMVRLFYNIMEPGEFERYMSVN